MGQHKLQATWKIAVKSYSSSEFSIFYTVTKLTQHFNLDGVFEATFFGENVLIKLHRFIYRTNTNQTDTRPKKLTNQTGHMELNPP